MGIDPDTYRLGQKKEGAPFSHSSQKVQIPTNKPRALLFSYFLHLMAILLLAASGYLLWKQDGRIVNLEAEMLQQSETIKRFSQITEGLATQALVIQNDTSKN